MSSHHIEFAARLSRIEARAASGAVTLFVGLDESYVIERRPRGGQARAAPAGSGAVLIAFVAGVLAFGLGLYLQFRLSAGTEPSWPLSVNLLIGGAIVLGISLFDGLSRPVQHLAKVTGVLVAALAFHNLVHFWPGMFSGMFSEQWVDAVLETTVPRSIGWQDRRVVF